VFSPLEIFFFSFEVCFSLGLLVKAMEKSDGYVLCALNGTPGSPRKFLFSFVNATRI
jgi:hypothetical protein